MYSSWKSNLQELNDTNVLPERDGFIHYYNFKTITISLILIVVDPAITNSSIHAASRKKTNGL